MIEYRQVGGDAVVNSGKLAGRVTPFNSPTEIGDVTRDGFHEQIAPGAFSKTLQERDIVLLWNHNKDMPLARTSAGNLSLEQRADGLHMQATPVQTSQGKDLMELVRAGVVKGMSFGFQVIKDSWSDDEGRAANSMTGTHRTIQEVKLHEVSAVTFPAYEDTSISARDIREGNVTEARKAFSAADRKAAAASGAAMPDGSFPIKDAEDLANAIHLAGNAKDPAAARKHIMARAKALGLTNQIPSTWNADGTSDGSKYMSGAIDTRDTIDGDDPNAEFYNVWSDGAIQNLILNPDQLAPNLKAALDMITQFLHDNTVTQSTDDSKVGDATEPGESSDGAFNEENAAQDELEMRLALAQAAKRMALLDLI